jgi:hypothetical protein
MGRKQTLLIARIEARFANSVDIFHQVPVKHDRSRKQPREHQEENGIPEGFAWHPQRAPKRRQDDQHYRSAATSFPSLLSG